MTLYDSVIDSQNLLRPMSPPSTTIATYNHVDSKFKFFQPSYLKNQRRAGRRAALEQDAGPRTRAGAGRRCRARGPLQADGRPYMKKVTIPEITFCFLSGRDVLLHGLKSETQRFQKKNWNAFSHYLWFDSTCKYAHYMIGESKGQYLLCNPIRWGHKSWILLWSPSHCWWFDHGNKKSKFPQYHKNYSLFSHKNYTLFPYCHKILKFPSLP